MSTTGDITIRDLVWHKAYSRWFDHRKAGHTIRAAVWGVIADAMVRAFWRTGVHTTGDDK